MDLKEKFHCLLCMAGPHTSEELANHNCPVAFKHGFKVVDGVLALHRTRWGRFMDWFFSLDIVYIMSFLAAATVNGLLIQYTPLTGWERLVEAVCVGIMMPRLFKKC